MQKSDTEKEYILEARNGEGAYEYRIILSTATEPAGKAIETPLPRVTIRYNRKIRLISLCTRVATLFPLKRNIVERKKGKKNRNRIPFAIR